jgi:hypothetical protein
MLTINLHKSPAMSGNVGLSKEVQRYCESLNLPIKCRST